jgi:hypothetical protein
MGVGFIKKPLCLADRQSSSPGLFRGVRGCRLWIVLFVDLAQQNACTYIRTFVRSLLFSIRQMEQRYEIRGQKKKKKKNLRSVIWTPGL